MIYRRNDMRLGHASTQQVTEVQQRDGFVNWTGDLGRAQDTSGRMLQQPKYDMQR